MSRLQQYYAEKVVPELKEKLGLTNTMAVPRITKVTLNMGVGEALADKKILDNAMNDLARISGQKPVPRLIPTIGPNEMSAWNASTKLTKADTRTR